MQSQSHAQQTEADCVSCVGESVCGRERGYEPILGLWEEGDWAVGLGKEGIEAVVGHCSDMRQAFCMIGKGRVWVEGIRDWRFDVKW